MWKNQVKTMLRLYLLSVPEGQGSLKTKLKVITGIALKG